MHAFSVYKFEQRALCGSPQLKKRLFIGTGMNKIFPRNFGCRSVKCKSIKEAQSIIIEFQAPYVFRGSDPKVEKKNKADRWRETSPQNETKSAKLVAKKRL